MVLMTGRRAVRDVQDHILRVLAAPDKDLLVWPCNAHHAVDYRQL